MAKTFWGRICPSCRGADITLLLNSSVCNKCDPVQGAPMPLDNDNNSGVIYVLINTQLLNDFPLDIEFEWSSNGINFLVVHPILEKAREHQKALKLRYPTEDCLIFRYNVQVGDKQDQFSSFLALTPAKWPVTLTQVK